jgi:hypothetical protein
MTAATITSAMAAQILLRIFMLKTKTRLLETPVYFCGNGRRCPATSAEIQLLARFYLMPADLGSAL